MTAASQPWVSIYVVDRRKRTLVLVEYLRSDNFTTRRITGGTNPIGAGARDYLPGTISVLNETQVWQLRDDDPPPPRVR